ncbi:MAG: hypothetical protein ABIW47_13795 [Ginsengibacter sp.]
MKTSNKLLAAFFILVFAVPFLMLVGFKRAIKKQEFTIVPFDNQFTHKIEIKSYKFIKIVGPEVPGYPGWASAGGEHIFSCKIIPADSVSYSYFTGQPSAKDVLILEQIGDTLLVKYSTVNAQSIDGDNTTYHFNPIQIDLFVPVLNNIIVENARVIIDSLKKNNQQDISFDLRNQANLQLGNLGYAQTNFGSGNMETDLNETKDSAFDSSYFRERSGKLLSVNIKASDASFTVGPYAWINHLQLQINGRSKVNINNNSRIDQLNGFISDSSQVSADWKNIRRLAALTTK